MSIVIKFYTFSKKENSTAQPSGTGDSFDCLIKTPSSLMFPYIELQSSTNPVAYNYAYISDFGRYYYVNDWKFDRGLWYASLTVDVLATYKTQIGSTPMYVLRASQQKNGAIRDNLYPLTGNVSIANDAFDTPTGIGYQNGYYVISTIGTSNHAGQTIYQMSSAQYANVMTQLFANASGGSVWDNLGDGIVNSLLNPTDYIVSAFWFPDPFDVSTTQKKFTCGLWDSGVMCDVLKNDQDWQHFSVNVPKHPQASTRGKFLNLSPYSYYDIDMGVMGTMALDSSKLVDASTFDVYIAADPLTGVAKIEGRVGGVPYQQLFNVTCNYGVPLNIAMGKNNLFDTITDAVSSFGKMLTGNVAGGFLGLADGIGSAVEAVIGNVTNTGSVGNINGHDRTKRLFARFFEVADDDNSHLGRPLCKVTTPSTLGTGYIKAQDCDISISAPASEIMMVKSKVEAGFFYE